jgi:uncharacterized protein
MSNDDSKFVPPGFLRGAYTQTVLASSRIRAVGRNPMREAACEMIIDAGGQVRLQGFFSAQRTRPALGLVILLHGWEGSAESTYVLHSGRYLYNQGYNIFRLNFRDHGNTHHLNEGVFYAILLDEVFNAVKIASGLKSPSRVFLMGFSLGGNFALRIARRCADDPIDNLCHVVAVSPALDPSKATDALDQSWLLRWYFLKKWRRSLAIKQKMYPQLYDFHDIMKLETLRALTDALLKKYSSYKDTQKYFMGYTLTGESIKKLSIPTTIIASRDDPAIPFDDFSGLMLGASTRLFMHDFGGHNGFLEGVFKPTWYEIYADKIFAEAT